MTNEKVTFPSHLVAEVEGVDCISQHNNATISAMVIAIARMTDDTVIHSLLNHIGELASETANEVNLIAERLGASFE